MNQAGGIWILLDECSTRGSALDVCCIYHFFNRIDSIPRPAGSPPFLFSHTAESISICWMIYAGRSAFNVS
jgi:hypothetical protein